MLMNALRIGQVAKEANVNIQTIRYYERNNLIPAPPRTESGYRQYSQDHVARVKFIKRAQELGFSLKEIVELLSLKVESDTICSDMQKQAEAKIITIETKIQMLQRINQTLTDLVNSCRENKLTNECPILTVLDKEG